MISTRPIHATEAKANADFMNRIMKQRFMSDGIPEEEVILMLQDDKILLENIFKCIREFTAMGEYVTEYVEISSEVQASRIVGQLQGCGYKASYTLRPSGISVFYFKIEW